MSQDQPDLNDTLRKLFERPRSSRKVAPTALFQQGQEPPGNGEDVPAPAPAAQQAPAVTPVLLKPLAQRFKSMIRWIPPLNRDKSKRRQRVVGLDVGTTAIKVVRLERLGAQARITAAAIEEFPEGLSEGPEREMAIQERISRMRKQGLLSGALVLSFYHQDGVVEPIRLPKMPMADLERAVVWEVQEKMSIQPDRSVIRFILTGELMEEGQSQQEVLVVTSPREPLLAYWRLFVDQGLKVIALEPISLAGFYGLERMKLWKPSETVGHLEIGFKVSHLSLIRGGVVRFNRSFPVGADSVTRAIADYCQVDYPAAEQMKRQYGISKMALEEDRHETGHESEDRVKVSHALGLHLEQLVAEIEHSFRYFAFELGGTQAERMDRLLITGGGALLKYLPEFLESRLSVPVQLVDPLKTLEIDPQVQLQIQPGWAQRLAVSIGLALRSVT
ncbi:MAG: pilus assembly protein PilM [Candidatus Omnitrophica bacterium]|nr:pilus assembly protein PilM [Candidatus Omnitrophota bacterium]